MNIMVKDIFFEVDAQYHKELHKLHHNLPFCLKEWNLRKLKKFVANLHGEKEYVI